MRSSRAGECHPRAAAWHRNFRHLEHSGMTRITEDTAMRAVTAQLGAHTLQGYWAVVPYQNGLVSFRESPGGGAFVPETHKVYAVELSNLLNREIAFGGKWIVSWSEFDLSTG